MVKFGEQFVFLSQIALQLNLEGILFEQVAHSDPDPGNLVHISRADSVLGGADLMITLGRLLAFIEQNVVWECHVRPARNPETGNINPIVLQIVELLQ